MDSTTRRWKSRSNWMKQSTSRRPSVFTLFKCLQTLVSNGNGHVIKAASSRDFGDLNASGHNLRPPIGVEITVNLTLKSLPRFPPRYGITCSPICAQRTGEHALSLGEWVASLILVMDSTVSKTRSAGWGAACDPCARAKARCLRSDSTPGARCDRSAQSPCGLLPTNPSHTCSLPSDARAWRVAVRQRCVSLERKGRIRRCE